MTEPRWRHGLLINSVESRVLIIILVHSKAIIVAIYNAARHRCSALFGEGVL